VRLRQFKSTMPPGWSHDLLERQPDARYMRYGPLGADLAHDIQAQPH
jgi:hypothetical protein